MAAVIILAAIALRYQGIEAEQQSDPEKRWRIEDRVAQSDGANRRGTEFANHDGVDHALGHPAEFAQHNRNRQRHQRAQFRAPLRARLVVVGFDWIELAHPPMVTDPRWPAFETEKRVSEAAPTTRLAKWLRCYFCAADANLLLLRNTDEPASWQKPRANP